MLTLITNGEVAPVTENTAREIHLAGEKASDDAE